MTQEIQEEKPVYHHVMPLQIRWNDVDKFGHVNNSVYFQFYDTAKTDYIATVCDGVDWDKVAIVVVHIEANFSSQVKADSNIAVQTRVSHVGNKSFHLDQVVIDADTKEEKCRCLSVMVLYDLIEQKAIQIPDRWARAIREYDNINE